MPISATKTLDGANDALTLSLDNGGVPIVSAAFYLLNTSSNTAVWKVQGRPRGQSGWMDLPWVNLSTFSLTTGGAFSAANATDYIVGLPDVAMFDSVRILLSSITSGSYAGMAYGFSPEETAEKAFPLNIVSSEVANIITSTAAAAFAVGRQGSTNPVLAVDASTASVVTGIKLTGAAAAAGMDITTTSSGTNENLTINAKGSGIVVLAPTSTGGFSVGSNATDRCQVKGIYKNPSAVSVAVPSITDPDIARVQVDVAAAFSIQPAVGDAVIAIPTGSLPSNCRLQGAYVYQTDGIEIVFGSEGGNVTGANVNFNFLVLDLT